LGHDLDGDVEDLVDGLLAAACSTVQRHRRVGRDYGRYGLVCPALAWLHHSPYPSYIG
jgi:hypothetical protein